LPQSPHRQTTPTSPLSLHAALPTSANDQLHEQPTRRRPGRRPQLQRQRHRQQRPPRQLHDRPRQQRQLHDQRHQRQPQRRRHLHVQREPACQQLPLAPPPPPPTRHE